MSEPERQRARAAKSAKQVEEIDRRMRNAYQTSRKDKGLKQSDVAARLGWSKSTIANFEQGRTRLTAGEFAVLCMGTDLDPDKVFRRGLRWDH